MRNNFLIVISFSISCRNKLKIQNEKFAIIIAIFCSVALDDRMYNVQYNQQSV